MVHQTRLCRWIWDWIGKPKPRNIKPDWRPYLDARRFVRNLGLASAKGYRKWCNGELADKPAFPGDIPRYPHEAYKGDWKGFPDFLGSKSSPKYTEMWSFEDARKFVRSLGLHSSTEYSSWCRGEHTNLPPKPDEIPIVPRSKYRNQWAGWKDWLGTD